MALLLTDRICKNCIAYSPDGSECRLTPTFVTRQAEEWCLEFRTWVPQDHPGASADDNWKIESRISCEDEKLTDNPLGRDVIAAEVVE